MVRPTLTTTSKTGRGTGIRSGVVKSDGSVPIEGKGLEWPLPRMGRDRREGRGHQNSEPLLTDSADVRNLSENRDV